MATRLGKGYKLTRSISGGTALTLMPYSRNSDFVVREKLFAELDNLLADDTRHQMAALYGIGGSG